MRPTTIVVPCFNEAARLKPALFREVVRARPGLAFVFVDDGSTDETAELLRELCFDGAGCLHYLVLDRNRGKAEAVRRGFQRAFEQSAELIGYWDADLATPLAAIPAMAALLEDPGCEIVMGSRVRLLGHRITRRAARHYLGRVFATFASLALNLPVYDTQCGAKLFRNTPVLQAVMAEPFQTGWTFDVELLARFLALHSAPETAGDGSLILEYPLEDWHDVPGSKLRARDVMQAALDLARIAAQYAIERRRPEPRARVTLGNSPEARVGQRAEPAAATPVEP